MRTYTCACMWVMRYWSSWCELMGRKPQLSRSVKSNVILLKEEGYCNKQITERFSISQASVSRILKRSSENLTLSPKKRSGRPRKTTPRTDTQIKRLCTINPGISSSEIKNSLPLLANVSIRTVRHHLHAELNLSARKPLQKPLLNARMLKQRLAFCNLYKHWTASDRRKVMFSDESTFPQFASYKPFIRRPPGSSTLNPRYIQPTVKHPPSLIVWGCFSSKGRGGLVFSTKTLLST